MNDIKDVFKDPLNPEGEPIGKIFSPEMAKGYRMNEESVKISVEVIDSCPQIILVHCVSQIVSVLRDQPFIGDYLTKKRVRQTLQFLAEQYEDYE